MATWVQAQKFRLSGGGIATTDTSITLQSFKLPDASTNIVTADFSNLGFATLEPGTAREEHISFTTVTQNADGTATLSGVTRGLDFTEPYTEVSANKKAHAGGTIFVLSNTAGFYNTFANKGRDETVTGAWSGITPTSAAHFATKSYVDSVVGGTTTTDKLTVAGTAGETVAAGNLIYFDDTDNEWKKTDADTAATVQGVILGIAQGAGTDGVSISGGVLLHGLDSNQSGLTAGAIYYASNTAGGVSSSAGTTEKVIGWSRSTTTLYFDPFFYYLLTPAQRSALADAITTSGIKSYVTVTLGATVAVGEAVYLKASDQKAYLTDTDLTITTGSFATGIHSTAPFLGIALEAGVLNDSKKVQIGGIVTGLTGLTAGTEYWLSGTAGGLTATPSTNFLKVGVALSTTTLLMDRRPVLTPKVRQFTNIYGSSTTQFDITDQGSSVFRYTYDTTGTDPVINSTTTPVGTVLVLAAQNFNAANNGTFVVIAVDTNYFEVYNASGVAESNKTLGSGTIKYGYQKPPGLKYIDGEFLGGGGGGGENAERGGGGGSGAFVKGMVPASALSATETLTIGAGGLKEASGGSTSLGSLIVAGGGSGASDANAGAGGTVSGTFTSVMSVSSAGSIGTQDTGPTPDFSNGGCGASSPYGTGGRVAVTASNAASGNMNGQDATGYGAGGGGAAGASTTAGVGSQGLIRIIEYF